MRATTLLLLTLAAGSAAAQGTARIGPEGRFAQALAERMGNVVDIWTVVGCGRRDQAWALQVEVPWRTHFIENATNDGTGDGPVSGRRIGAVEGAFVLARVAGNRLGQAGACRLDPAEVEARVPPEVPPPPPPRQPPPAPAPAPQ